MWNCQNPEAQLERKAVKEIKSKLRNPKSMEVDLVMFSEKTYQDIWDVQKSALESELEEQKKNLKLSSKNESEVVIATMNLQNFLGNITAEDSLKMSDVRWYQVEVDYRAKNGFGGMSNDDAIVLFTPSQQKIATFSNILEVYDFIVSKTNTSPPSVDWEF